MLPLKPARPVPAFFFQLLPFLAGLLFLATGCVAPKPNTDPVQDARAKALVLAAQALNEDMTGSKGLGRLTLNQPQGVERLRLAWAAQPPNRLRLTVLASAHPIETIAASGDWVSIVSHTGKHKPHSAASTDPDLNSYINVPVRLSDMVSILLGRIPVRPFDRAWFVPGHTDLVRTSQNFSSQIQEIAFDPDGNVTALALMDRNGNDIFRIVYQQYQTVGNRLLPETMTLTDAGAHSLDLTLFRIEPNPEIKESVFRLTGSGS